MLYDVGRYLWTSEDWFGYCDGEPECCAVQRPSIAASYASSLTKPTTGYSVSTWKCQAPYCMTDSEFPHPAQRSCFESDRASIEPPWRTDKESPSPPVSRQELEQALRIERQRIPVNITAFIETRGAHTRYWEGQLCRERTCNAPDTSDIVDNWKFVPHHCSSCDHHFIQDVTEGSSITTLQITLALKTESCVLRIFFDHIYSTYSFFCRVVYLHTVFIFFMDIIFRCP